MKSLIEVELGALSDPGKVRENNEDRFFVARLERAMQTIFTNLSAGEVPERHFQAGYGMLVADGVGGAAAGEVASTTAIRVLIELGLETPDWIMSLEGERGREVLARMQERFRKIRDVFVERAEAEPALVGMGTTMTLAASVGADLIIAHIGDSRAYLLRGGKLLRLTRDQTLAQALADAGTISPEQVATHPSRHVLTGAITTEEGAVPAELERLRLADGDQLLLCSDGLTEMASDDEIAGALDRAGSAARACRALVDLALKGGGRDNVTVVLARYHIPQ
jgi:protein phosphatase